MANNGLAELTVKDLGGAVIDPGEMFTVDLVRWVDNLNTDLGTPNDPHYNEYKNFYNEINSANIITLEADQFQEKNGLEDIDLLDEKIPTDDFGIDKFFVFMNSIMFLSKGLTPFDLPKGNQEFMPFTDRGIAPFDDFTVACTK